MASNLRALLALLDADDWYMCTGSAFKLGFEVGL